MKRYGWLYEKAFTKDNIKIAIHKASKGKRKRKGVQRILADEDFYVDEIYEMMQTQSFKPSSYTKFSIKDPSSGKIRDLCKPRFYPDHIVHWCIYMQLYPIIEPKLIKNTYSSLKGRGQIYGQKRIKKQLRNKHDTKYYMKVDIKKFYPSIDTDLLEDMLRNIIKDPKMLSLIHDILSLEKGLPIGMILSQLLANFYLCDVDAQLNSKYMNRYADDMVKFFSSKREAHKEIKHLSLLLAEKHLTLKGNYQVYKLDKEMLDFMGFRFNHDKIILRRRILINTNRDVLNWQKCKSYHNACSIMSHMGYIKHSNSFQLYLNRIRPYVDFKEVKEIIRSANNENLQIGIEHQAQFA